MRLPSVGVVVRGVAATRRLCFVRHSPADARRRRKSGLAPVQNPSPLCGFAALADEAKGGDGAKSALREIFLACVIFPGCELLVLISLCWSPEISTNWPFSFRFF